MKTTTWKWVAILSIGVNAALLLGSIGRRNLQPAEGPSTAAPAPEPRPPAATSTSPKENAPDRPVFHWSQVESADYPIYIANLRRIGCPEATLRDIIVADVHQLFAPRYAALSATAPELAWWGRFDPRKPVRPELSSRLRELDAEKRALLTRLLGPTAATAVPWVDSTVATVREHSAWSFLPESKQAAVRELIARHEALREWNAAQWKGLPSDEREAKERALHEARQRTLASMLTPEEMREFELRDSPTATALREEYGRANLTEAEYRRLHELRREFEQNYPDAGREDWKRLEGQYAGALGPERFADLQRQNDSMWQALQTLATDGGYSSDTLSRAYAIKQDYSSKLVEAVGQMFADPQQNPQPLRDIASAMDAQLAGVLGLETVRHLDRLGVLPRLVIQDDGQRRSYSFSRGGFAE